MKKYHEYHPREVHKRKMIPQMERIAQKRWEPKGRSLTEMEEEVNSLIAMKAEKGIWAISSGKGNRMYISCLDQSKIGHPESICGQNGLLVYDWDNLKDLAITILRFEKEKQNNESIINEV
jgi:hypothetical protein